jgi:hypothetical protein
MFEFSTFFKSFILGEYLFYLASRIRAMYPRAITSITSSNTTSTSNTNACELLGVERWQ